MADVAHQFALQVGGFVLMPGAALGEAVDHAQYFGQELLGGGLIGHFA